MKKLRKIISFVFVLMLLMSSIGTIDVSALEVTLAISPSKVYDVNIDLGESKEFTFNIANKGFIDTNGTPLELIVNIEGTIEDQFGETIENNGILTFDRTEIRMEPDKVEQFKATLNIPSENFIKGNYCVYVDVIQQPIEGFPLGSQTNVLRVPMYIFVGDVDEYSNTSVDFEIVNNKLEYGTEPTTIPKEVFNSCIKVLNPLNIVPTYKDILNRPVYTFINKNNEQIVDINNNIYVDLKRVATTKEKLTNTKYVYYKKEWLNEKVLRTAKNAGSIDILLANEKIVKIEGTQTTLNFINQQLISIASQSKEITLNDLFNKLKVSKNKKYEMTNPVLITEVKFNGDIPAVLKGEFLTLKNYSDEIEKGQIFSPTLMPNNTAEIKTVVATKELTNGDYSVNGFVGIRQLLKEFNYNFELNTLRYIIIICVTVFLIIYFAIILIILYGIKRAINKKKKDNKKVNEDENDKGENIEEMYSDIRNDIYEN